MTPTGAACGIMSASEAPCTLLDRVKERRGRTGMRVGIIGGGASGMMAALTAARHGADVTLLEKNEQLGKKLLATGNGKCNFSNLSFSDICYFSGDRQKAAAVFDRFMPRDAVRFFEELGMRVCDRDGYLYPASQQAVTVQKVFSYALRDAGVDVRCNAVVKKLQKEQDMFYVRCQDGREEAFHRIILACGGKAAPKTGSDGSGYYLAGQFGHTMTDTVPALVQLRCGEKKLLAALAGVRCDALLTLYCDGRAVACERGELQLTDYGLSGIVTFQLSRTAAFGVSEGKTVTAGIDLLPDWTEAQVRTMAQTRLQQFGERTAEAFFTGLFHAKWTEWLIAEHGFSTDRAVNSYPREQAVSLLLHAKRILVTVTGCNSFEHAQTTAGGIPWSEVTERLMSQKVLGLYFAGELLDVDGKCGGYNLQWAWSSGNMAGEAAACDV